MSKYTRQQFITKLAPYAIQNQKQMNVSAALTIAQGILESADGNSALAVQANNLFGIKGTGTAGTISMPTKEFINNQWVTVNANFRKYNNWGESVIDHSKLFYNGVSWNRTLYHGVLFKDGITAAREVHKAGYATDPEYSNKLIKLMNDNNLLRYELEAEQPEPTKPTIEQRLEIIESRLLEIPAPPWFNEEFPGAINLIHQQTGTIDFWRSFAVSLRILKQNNYFS